MELSDISQLTKVILERIDFKFDSLPVEKLSMIVTLMPFETKYLETKKRYDTLAHGGLIDLYRYGGFI